MFNEQTIVDQFIEIDPKENFSAIKETLTRMGVPSAKKPELYQSCHILHKRGKFYIVHFKEMFLLDGKTANFDDMDIKRRNKVASLLHEWGLCVVKDPSKITDQCLPTALVVIPFAERTNWALIPKYSLGRPKKDNT